MTQKLTLDQIKNLPEEEFRKHLMDWVEEMDISKELYSKLMSDLFHKFGTTTLGRQIALQYQQSQRIVLSPLALVINTLVAEFLYAQNCHFSLSIFNTEVPFKNTIPDFERNTKFRFNSVELCEIVEQALGLANSDLYKSKIIRSYETPIERDGILTDSSLLFCVIQTLCKAVSGTEKHEKDRKEPQDSPKAGDKCRYCSTSGKPKKDELNSKYFRHFSKYLKLLSQHVVEISHNSMKLKESTKSKDQHTKSSSKNSNLNKRLDKIIESLRKLPKSNRRGRTITKFIETVTRLTNEIERCSSNVAKYSTTLKQSSKGGAISATKYTEWLSQMTKSIFGQRFIRNLEIAQERAMTKEVDKIKEIFNEKCKTSRMLIKLHYQQKTLEKFRSTFQNSGPNLTSNDFNTLIDEKLRLLKEKESNWKQSDEKGVCRKTSVDDMNFRESNQEVLSDQIAISKNMSSCRTTDKESQTSKPIRNRRINVEIFNDTQYPMDHNINIVQIAKNRLQELESESNQLDKTFEIYIQKQNEQKQDLADNVAKVWDQYKRTKETMTKTFIVPKLSNDSTMINVDKTYISVPMEAELEERIVHSKTDSFDNPYKRLHANLTMSMIGLSIKNNFQEKKDELISKNEGYVQCQSQSIDVVQQSENLVDNHIPMKIKSIMKKESKPHLKINESSNCQHHVPDFSNISPLQDIHLSDSKPSESSAI